MVCRRPARLKLGKGEGESCNHGSGLGPLSDGVGAGTEQGRLKVL